MFEERLADRFDALRPSEQRVASFFQDHSEDVLLSSATALAEKTATSDATVVRTAKALGFSGLNELKQVLAAELRQKLTPADRMERMLGAVGDDLAKAFGLTMEIHAQSLQSLRRSVTDEGFCNAVTRIVNARRIFIFGIGPSSAMADYFAMQLSRFGLEAAAMTRTGILFADELRRLRESDLIIMLAYGRVYQEIAALIDETERQKIPTVLITDTLAARLRNRVDLILPVARGRAEMLSMHTATLGLIEALLVGVATKQPDKTMDSLRHLNAAREKVTGEPMDLHLAPHLSGSND